MQMYVVLVSEWETFDEGSSMRTKWRRRRSMRSRRDMAWLPAWDLDGIDRTRDGWMDG